MVRLKAECEKWGGMNKGFQFLMVRLKARLVYLQSRFLNISIPYGAIKSTTQTASLQVHTCISIPYGAIKSVISLSST